jgi:hypothetical protein
MTSPERGAGPLPEHPTRKNLVFAFFDFKRLAKKNQHSSKAAANTL